MTSTVTNIAKVLVAAALVALLAFLALIGITPVYATDATALDPEAASLSVPSDFTMEAEGAGKEILPVYQGAEAAESSEVLPVYQYMNAMQAAA